MARPKDGRRTRPENRRTRLRSRRSPLRRDQGTTMTMLSRLLALGCVLALLAGVARAQGIAWEDLSDAQRQVLAGQAQHWKDLSPARQQQTALGAQCPLGMDARARELRR